MSDLNVVAVIRAKLGSEAVVRAALTALIQPTRDEAGCVTYDLFTSDADPTTFITIEKWRSQSDLDAHMRSAHIQNALDTVGSHLAATPAIHPLRHVDGQ